MPQHDISNVFVLPCHAMSLLTLATTYIVPHFENFTPTTAVVFFVLKIVFAPLILPSALATSYVLRQKQCVRSFVVVKNNITLLLYIIFLLQNESSPRERDTISRKCCHPRHSAAESSAMISRECIVQTHHKT